MNKGYLFFILLLLPGLSACHLKKNLTKVKIDEPVATDIDILKNQLHSHPTDYKWLDTEGQLEYDDGTSDVNANLFMRNRKDSVIWASANVLIEAIRLLVNNDSAIILNRVQKSYTVFPVKDLSNTFEINNLNLESVQNLLHALPPFGIDNKCKFVKTNDLYQLENQQPTYRELISIDASTLRMSQYRYERNNTQYVVVNYSGFKKTGNVILPDKIDMEIHTPDKIHIVLNVSNYSLTDTDDVPFYIPKSYTKAH